MSDDEGLASRLDQVRARVRRAAERAGRDPRGVRILAVTKAHPAAAIDAALRAGIADIGESRVQEAMAKQSELPGRMATWHMIGHVQRNKARAAAAIFDVVHSVDSARLGSALERYRAPADHPLTVLIEVELTGIPGRSGVSADVAPALLAELRRLPRLEPVGLMTIAPPGSQDRARDCFARLRALRDRLSGDQSLSLPELSMGMSDDFEVAVAEGSTMVRLGRVLFGDRSEAQPGAGPPLS
ncbi:MAG TPA: YggS family pyridoxal phosphate-dependent enzyme [Candidatus Dormibacteraeota bacterium]|nr:YggS family pyridoxal phosphate-dependent enzyme [Candidatus Dormibacteraeota bacterium]